MPLNRLHNSHMRQPIPNYGQQLVNVIDVGGDQQRSIHVLALLLMRQQRTTCEVKCYFRGYAQKDFSGVFSKPNVVLGINVFPVHALRLEAAGCIHVQTFNQRNTEVFQLSAFFRR